jgi:hypothetical protein
LRPGRYDLDDLCLRVEPFDGAAIAKHLAAQGVACGAETLRYGRQQSCTSCATCARMIIADAARRRHEQFGRAWCMPELPPSVRFRRVRLYQIDSYRYWERQLGRKDFVFGQFGENFTVDGLSDDEVCIGDRYRIGNALFEVRRNAQGAF